MKQEEIEKLFERLTDKWVKRLEAEGFTPQQARSLIELFPTLPSPETEK